MRELCLSANTLQPIKSKMMGSLGRLHPQTTQHQCGGKNREVTCAGECITALQTFALPRKETGRDGWQIENWDMKTSEQVSV